MSQAVNMDVASARENSQTGRSSSPKKPTSALNHEFDPNGKCCKPVEQKHETAENVQQASAEARVVESSPINVEQLRHPEDSTKNSSCEPVRQPPEVATISGLKQMELPSENVTRITSSLIRTTSGLKLEFGSESVNSEPLEQKEVIGTENIQNGPVEIRKANFDHIGLEQVGPPPEEATGNFCWEQLRPLQEDLTMKCSLEQLRLPEDSTKNSSCEPMRQPTEDATISSLKQMELLSESLTKMTSNLKRTTSGLKHEFGPDSVNSEQLEQTQVIGTNNVQNGPIEIHKADCDHIGLEQVGPHPESTGNFCCEQLGTPQEDPTRQLRLPEDSTKNLSCEPMRQLPEDATISSLKQMELPSESVTRMTSSLEHTTSGQKHEFGSNSVNSEQLEQKQVICTENVQNGPVEIRKADCAHIGLRSPQEDLTMRRRLEQLGLPRPPENAVTNSSFEQLGQPPDDASKNSGLEQLVTPQVDEAKNPSQSGHRKKGTSVRSGKGKNTLTSLIGSTRVLRTRSQEKSKVPEPSNTLAGDENGKKKRKKKQLKKIPVNEFSRIKRHLAYLLTRMQYEQNLIDAYSGEGWKGQSLEKIKPEKELQRAKSEIFRCKLKIRDLFRRLDMSCAEGRLPESLFDSKGEIDSEDIFCAKCGSTDVSANNDIILCDGACERGFHQFCLEPPLLKKDIPPGDEGWLCPGCDCKFDCTKSLNDSQGTNLSSSDRWEKVFPEAAAAAAGNKLDDNFGLSSDDSEDDDYDPDGPDLDEKVQEDKSSSDKSDFSSAFDDLGALPNNDQYLGLPSDDSEDDDYNPDGLDLEEQVKKESSSSDFTSDSEDFSVTFDDNRPSDEVQWPMSSTSDLINPNGERSKLCGTKRQSLSDELLSLLESDPVEDDSAPLFGKRPLKRLDYKRLHDETYGNVSSDSSDEDYMDSDTAAPKRRKKNTGKVASVSPNRNAPTVKHGTDAKDMKHSQKESEHTPKRRTSKKLDVEGTNNSPASHSVGKSTARSTYKRLGEAVTQRLYESFKENQYPERAVKEKLAKELALTLHQVNKWFENARWSFRHSSRMESTVAESASNKSTQINKKLPDPEPEPEPKMVTDDAASFGIKEKELPKASPGLIACGSGDMRTGNSATKVGNGQNSTTPTPRKKKVNSDQATDPILNMEETLRHSALVNSPNAQEVRRSGRIQSRSRKPLS